MGGKRQEEKRKFIIAGHEYWFTKKQMQEEFGCSKEEAEEMWQKTPISKATEWLNSQKKSTTRTYKSAWKKFEEFTGMTSDQIIEDRKSDTEHKWERKVLDFKQWLLDYKKLSSYSVIMMANAVRSFFAYHYSDLKYRKSEAKKLSERTRKTEDYKFIVEDLKKMTDVADLNEKYVLVVGKSLGLRAGDFLKLTRGDFDAYIDNPVPISMGEIGTGKEKVRAFPFIDADAKPVIKMMLDKMTREGRTKPTERILTFKERQLSQTLKRLAERAGLETGNKQLRFHCLRKFLIDNISGVMSESKWKQIVGKKISESAYVSSEGLREDYERAMSKTTFTKKVADEDLRLMVQKEWLIQLAKAQGLKDADLKKIFRSKKAFTTKEQVKALEEFTERNKPKNNNCSDGEHCQHIVKEEELGGLLAQGWRVAAVLPSGKIVISNEY